MLCILGAFFWDPVVGRTKTATSITDCTLQHSSQSYTCPAQVFGAWCSIIDQLAGEAMSRKCHQNAKSNIQDGTNSSCTCSSLGLEAANGFGCGRVASGASGLGKGEPLSTEIIYVLLFGIGKVAHHL